MSLFLEPYDLRTLTGFTVKAKQIEQLRKMRIPFFVNGCGKPVVTVAAVQGLPQTTQARPTWKPSVLQNI